MIWSLVKCSLPSYNNATFHIRFYTSPCLQNCGILKILQYCNYEKTSQYYSKNIIMKDGRNQEWKNPAVGTFSGLPGTFEKFMILLSLQFLCFFMPLSVLFMTTLSHHLWQLHFSLSTTFHYMFPLIYHCMQLVS